MHVCFASCQAATACLALNGQLLLGKIMIGCIPCTHAALLAATGDCLEQESVRAAPGTAYDLRQMSAGPGRPEVRRNGLLWRMLDQLFDI
ncbi:unnamed protein product [Effrenium voratum]|nr:unnamed protein product [Effrenium voratum]